MADSKPINWAYPFKAKAADGDSSPSNVTPALYYDALANAKDGFYPLGANGLWHGGIHFDGGTAASLDQSAIGCIADGEIVAYRIDDRYPTSQYGEGPTAMHLPFSSGFVLVKHSLVLPEPSAPAATEEGSAAETAAAPASAPLTFYSLYMHLLDWTGYKAASAPTAPDFLGDTLYSVKADKATDNLAGLRVRSAAKTGTVKALLAKGSKVKVGDSDPTSAKWRKLLTIIEGSAIPALSGEELGWVYTGEMDEVPGETDTYLVADGAQDTEPTVANTMGLNVRKAGSSSSKITGLLPLSAKFKIKSGSGAYRELVEIVEGQDIAPLSANSVQRIKGFVHFDSLDAVRSVPTLDRVQILARPLPIKAGDLVGHLGQYQNYSDNRPRSLVHIEVFTCEDMPAFIAKSQAVAARLPAEQKTLIKVHAGSSILQPSAADSQVPAGLDVRLSSDSPKEGCWAKVQQYAELKIDKSSLGSYDATHKRYALNAAQKSTIATQLGVEASELPDTADFLLEYYDADGSNPQTYTSGGIPAGQPMRKIGVHLNTAYWVARNKLNSQGGRSSTSGTLDAWRAFPLQTGTDGQACGYDRILSGASWGNLANEHKAIAPDNIRWWYVTVGDKDGKDISGWVPEVDPIITKHSPWEWPGFSTLQDKAPLDAHLARTLDATGRATEEETQSYTALIDEAERGPILSELYKVIDLPNAAGVRDNKLTPAELKTALGKPWLAQQLSLLISQYESEWMWNADKWNQLDKLMEHTPEDPNPNWMTEKKRIETLGWWSELAGQPGIATNGVAWHFHSVGMSENFILDNNHPIIIIDGTAIELKFLEFFDESLIDDSDYLAAAALIGCEVAAIKAVSITETGSSGSYFIKDGDDKTPAILYERHYFHNRTNGSYSSTHPEISNSNPGGYGAYSSQYKKLLKAYALDSTAALKSASWGRFQIMGSNHAAAGYATVEEFVSDISKSEKNHLKAFVNFIKADPVLSSSIISKDWLKFALRYNGPNQDGYDTRMEQNYNAIISN